DEIDLQPNELGCDLGVAFVASFCPAILDRHVATLNPAEFAQSLHKGADPKPLKKRDTTWVEPRFDAEITYAEITDDGMVRHPVLKALVPWRDPTSHLIQNFRSASNPTT